MIIVIVHGDDVAIDAAPGDSLAVLRARALEAYGEPRPAPDEWELRDERGARLDPTALVRDTPMGRPARLFLGLPVGAGA